MPEREHPVILFDGVCNFCNAGINFIIRHDKKKFFRFSPLQSAAGISLQEKFHLDHQNPDSFIVIDREKVYKYSDAGLFVYGNLAWYLKWTKIFWLVPKVIRDPVYHFIARNRYKWFGKKETCMIPSPDVRDRFLPI
jgi:predicted DCC family thiol-disulfide oxidoreductase YuxK